MISPKEDFQIAQIYQHEEQERSNPALTPADATLDSQETSKSEAMAALIDFSNPVRAPRLPCKGMLKTHTVNPDFFGRTTVLDQLHEFLQPEDQTIVYNEPNSLRSFVLCGFGGIGKTQIAVQYAFSKNRDYDAIFWVQADRTEKIASSFRDMAIELHLMHSTDELDPIVTRNLVMEWLSTPYKRSSDSNDDTPHSVREMAKWLIIFDNADRPELLRDFWPVSGNGSALVTSRNPLTKDYLRSTSGIDLQPFAREDAAFFLRKLTATSDGSDTDHKISLMLSNRLGGFPLALVHVAAITRKNRWTLKEMLEKYDKKTIRPILYNFTEMSPRDKYTHTLSTIWGIEDLGDHAHCLLNVIAFLDPDAIDESIIETKIDKHCINGLDDMQDSFAEARTSLIAASLVKRDKDKMQLTIHRVVQEGTRNRMSSQLFGRFYGSVVEILLKAWYHDPEEKFTHNNALWDVAKVVSPHATHIKTVFDRQNPELDPDAMFSFARLLQKNGWYLCETGYPEIATPFLELALSLSDSLPQKSYSDIYGQDEQTLLADVLFCLATLSADQNQPKECLEYAERHFDVRMRAEKRKKALGRHAGLAYTELGLAYLKNNRFQEAIDTNRAGRALLVQLPLFKEGKYWPDFAVIHEVMALIELNREVEALPLLEEAIEFRRKRFGPDDTQSFKLGYYLQLLATVYSRRGDLDTGFHYYQRALANFRATVGDHYHRTSQVCVKLAEYHASKNQVEAASILFDQALKNFDLRTFSKPELALTKHKKAKFMRDIGNLDAATELADSAWRLYKEILPGDGPTCAADLRDEDFEKIVPMSSR